MRRAIFLDRDGVINPLVFRPDEGTVDSPYSLDEFCLLPRAGAAVRAINHMGRLAVVVSNQPGVAKGKCSHRTLDLLTQKMMAELARHGANLDGCHYCLHHPDGIVAEYRSVCSCRKPEPGLLLQAAKELDIDLAGSYMIGDRGKDIQAGRTAGCRTILLDYGEGHPVMRWDPACRPDFVVYDLMEAVRLIQEREGAGASIH